MTVQTMDDTLSTVSTSQFPTQTPDHPSSSLAAPTSVCRDSAFRSGLVDCLQGQNSGTDIAPSNGVSNMERTPLRSSQSSPVHGLFTEEEKQSSCSNESDDISIDDELRLVLLYMKHRLIVELMRDIYAMFSGKWIWNDKMRSCAVAGSGPLGNPSREPKVPESQGSSFQRPSKRQRLDRESPPRDDRNRKRKKADLADPKMKDASRLFACPFNKFDPRKYSTNSGTGATYRSCAGPGFSKIARLK